MKPPKPQGYLTAPSAKALTKDRPSINANIGKIAGVNKGLLKKAPKTPQQQGGRPLLTNATPIATAPPEDPVMTLFRSTLKEINNSATPVDEAGIRAPFTESMGVATQLGAGQAAADAANSARASDQYGKAAAEANAHSAAAGIGAGASTEARPDDTQSLLAQQSQAQQNAAVGAGAAWAQLLNRVAGATVSAAKRTRQNSIDTASESLAASLPSMYNNAGTLALQQQATDQNGQIAAASLGLKRDEFLTKDATTRFGITTAANTSTGNNKRTNSSADARLTRTIADHERHDNQTEKGLTTRARNAQKTKGLQGVPQALDALKIAKATDSTKPGGWLISVQNQTSSGTPYGPITKVPYSTNQMPDATHPNGYPGGVPSNMHVVGVPQSVTKTVKGVSAGMTLAQWNKAVGILYSYNKGRGMTPAQAAAEVQSWTPKPPK